MKYLYIKILILLAILIPSTLVIESNAAGSNSIRVHRDKYGSIVYYPKTGNVCWSYFSHGYETLQKLVLKKNLSLNALKKVKGSFPGVVLGAKHKFMPNDVPKNWSIMYTKLKFNDPGRELNFPDTNFELSTDDCNTMTSANWYKKLRKNFNGSLQ